MTEERFMIKASEVKEIHNLVSRIRFNRIYKNKILKILKDIVERTV
jgi:hypothetical protein